jgi:hypothetical protein
MRLITLCLIVLAAEIPETIATAAATDGGYPPLFTTEMNARVHCPNDVVVWLTVPSSIYRFRGQRSYGDTADGAYVCKKDADQAGDRATGIGQ